MSEKNQLPLPLDLAPRYGRKDFLLGRANANAFAYLERYPRWLSPAMVLVGPTGSGKSHLAAIFAAMADAHILRGDRLTREEVPTLALAPALVVEDCDRSPPEEAALFHLINMARENGRFLMLTARKNPDFWGIQTPDLLSRLRAQPLLTLDDPDDTMLHDLLIKLMNDKQLRVEPHVVTYALARAERSYAGMMALVAALDTLSLSRQKPITRALVAEVLGVMEEEEA